MEVAILLHPNKEENYSTLAYWHLSIKNKDLALKTIDRGLEINKKSS